MSFPTFRVFWLRENGCEAGVVRAASEIEHSIRDRVVALTGGESGEFTLRLPYMDRYEWKRRGKALRALEYEREGHLIRAILKPAGATLDMAATLAFTDPAWKNTPREREPAYHEVWHRVSATVQRTLKEGMAEEYFRDLSRLETRDSAYTMIVYQSSRAFTGKARHRYTYDLRDYPACRPAVAASTAQIGGRMKTILEQIHRRLIDAGRPALARRYTPAWHPDIISAVRRKPRRFLDLLMREAEIVDAVIELGTERTTLAVYSCARKINAVLRCIQGADLRTVGVTLLQAATAVLAQTVERGHQNIFDARVLEGCNAIAARGPYARIGSQKYRNDGDTYRGRQVPDAGIVADIQTGGGEPLCQPV